jgi:hypothetical protein
MHLRSLRDQEVSIRNAGIAVRFRRGETIWTESSHKFELPEVTTLAADSGFDCVRQWVDQEWPFAENLLIARARETCERAGRRMKAILGGRNVFIVGNASGFCETAHDENQAKLNCSGRTTLENHALR